jgi:hypothetical protein
MLRLMRETPNTVPVPILTGFRGSGKTTAVNHPWHCLLLAHD